MITRIGAALVAGALVAGASACDGLSTTPGPAASGPATAGLTRQWTANETGGMPGSSGAWVNPGAWFTSGMMVAPGTDGLAGISLRTGRTEWSWSPPAAPPGDRVSISLSNGTADGIGLVTYDYESRTENTRVSPPGYAAGIDLASGRTLWTHPVSPSLNVAPPGQQLGGGVSAELVNPGRTRPVYVAATSLATGKPAWSTRLDPALRGCDFTGLAVDGAAVYGVADCQGKSVLYGLSARTGAVASEAAIGACDSEFADGKPTLWAASGYLLVGCPGGKSPESQQVLAFRAGSGRPAGIAYANLYSSFQYPDDPADHSPQFAVVGTTLCLLVEGTGDNEFIDGFSLVSGKRLWHQKSPGAIAGTGENGVVFVSKNVPPADSGPASVSLSAVSARSGTISYGPGTRLNVSDPDGYRLTLAGHTLIAAAANPDNTPVIAYSTGDWRG